MTEFAIVSGVIAVIAGGVFILFRFWAARAPTEQPMAAVLLLGILAGILLAMSLTPSPMPSGANPVGAMAFAAGDGMFRAIQLALGLLAGLLAAAMGLGTWAGARRRLPNDTNSGPGDGDGQVR